MSLADEHLLETYMWGFNDELRGRERVWNPNPLLLRAYNLGRDDAVIGDEVTSTDQQTNQEIVDRIRGKKDTKEDTKEKSLYSEIEYLIIDWNNDGTKTAGHLTRQIMKLLGKEN